MRTRPYRLFAAATLSAAVAASLFAGTANLAPGSYYDPDVWNLSALRNGLRESHDQTGQLDADLATVLRNNEARLRVARDLAAGRVTVREAADRFHDLGVNQPHFWAAHTDQLSVMYPGVSEAERECRHVVDWTCREAADDPALARALRDRLERQLGQELRASAPARPNVTPSVFSAHP